MKLTEQQLREILHNHTIEIPVTITSVDDKKREVYVKPVCTELGDNPLKAGPVEEEELPYKYAHKRRAQKAREEKTTTKPETPVCWMDMEATGDTTSPGEYVDRDYCKDYVNPYEKMSEEEKSELKDLLMHSEELKGKLFKASGGSPVLPDKYTRAELLNAWKKYKEDVNKWIGEHKKFPAPIAKAILLDEYPEELKPAFDPVATFKELTDNMFETYKKKNADYGSSFDELFDEFGMTSALLRMKDKYNRLKSITEKGEIQVKDESVEDTLLDLANYAILTVIKLRQDKYNNK